MLALSHGLDVFVVHEPVSFGMGMTGLSLYCETILSKSALSGALFVFRNKRSNMLRVLVFDGAKLWLVTGKQVEGKIPWWPKGQGVLSELAVAELHILLHGGHALAAFIPSPYRQIPTKTKSKIPIKT
jgi:transposase